MPQHIFIEIGGVCIAHMWTSRLGGTRYDIYWESNQVYRKKISNRNTGVDCQPTSNLAESRKDSKNDFIHARRSIAAASSTAKQFLDNLDNKIKTNNNNIEEVQIILKTNTHERGKLTISPTDDQKAKLTMKIVQVLDVLKMRFPHKPNHSSRII